MKHVISSLVLAACLAWNPAYKQQPVSSEKYFQVEIVQSGKVVEEKNDTVWLEKKPFKFKLTYFKTDHIYVSNSWGTYYYGYPDNKNIFECSSNSLKDCRFVAVKTGLSDKYNSEKDIYVGDGSYQTVWSYDENRPYRMDSGVVVNNGIIHAEVTVKYIYDCDKRDSYKYKEPEYNYPIEKIEQNIFCVFATDHYKRGMDDPKELQREKFVLAFR